MFYDLCEEDSSFGERVMVTVCLCGDLKLLIVNVQETNVSLSRKAALAI